MRSHKSKYFPCRCKRKDICFYRVTLRHKPDADDKCPQCGRELVLDTYRINQRKLRGVKRKDPGPVCYCAAAPGRDGRNMPHRAGSLVNCERYGVPF